MINVQKMFKTQIGVFSTSCNPTPIGTYVNPNPVTCIYICIKLTFDELINEVVNQMNKRSQTENSFVPTI
jgi:hypothetical protein